MFNMPGGFELIIIFFIVLLLFGAKRLPEVARGLGSSIREFKNATRGIHDEITTTIEDEDNQEKNDSKTD